MEQRSARSRKPFQYKADDDSDDSMPEALDEEEQDSLIRTLNTQNETRNTQYTTAFTAFCLLCTFPYLITFYSSGTSAQASLLSILSITSLLSSAYTLYALPSSTTGFAALDAFWAKRPAAAAAATASRHNDDERETLVRLPRLGDRVDRSPLELYLPGLNLVLVGLTALIGVVLGSGPEGAGLGTLYALLPAGVLGLLVVVKLEMRSVDVGELEGLRYGYRGA